MNLFHPIIRSFIRYYNAIHLEVNFWNLLSFFSRIKFHSCDIKLMKYRISIYIYTMHKITIYPHKNKLIQKFFFECTSVCTRVCKWNAFLRFFHGKHADGVESRKRAITMFAAPKIRSGNGRPVFSRSRIVRSRARFTQLTNHYGGLESVYAM